MNAIPFEQAKTQADALWQSASRAGLVLDAFPKGQIGLTPDSVKATPEWRTAKRAFDQANAASRAFNAWYVKAYKAELAAARRARFA
jgi:hypothetical protein